MLSTLKLNELHWTQFSCLVSYFFLLEKSRVSQASFYPQWLMVFKVLWYTLHEWHRLKSQCPKQPLFKLLFLTLYHSGFSQESENHCTDFKERDSEQRICLPCWKSDRAKSVEPHIGIIGQYFQNQPSSMTIIVTSHPFCHELCHPVVIAPSLYQAPKDPRPTT